MKRMIALGFVVLAGLAYMATGWTIVAPGEVVVVRRFGRVLDRVWDPGPHFGAPWGIDRHTRVRLDEVQRLEIGLAGVAGPDDEPGAGEFLTADLNLIRARAVVQYRIQDPIAYVTRVRDGDALLARLAEASLARALAHTGIDEALRAGGGAVAEDAETHLRGTLRRQRLGLEILGVRLTDAKPPVEVQPDFDAAQSARSEASRREIDAQTQAALTTAEAGAVATAKVDAAHAQADRAVALAHAKAERFLALLSAARQDRALTVARLYRDTLRDLLPKVRRKLVVAPDEPVDLSILGVDR